MTVKINLDGIFSVMSSNYKFSFLFYVLYNKCLSVYLENKENNRFFVLCPAVRMNSLLICKIYYYFHQLLTNLY